MEICACKAIFANAFADALLMIPARANADKPGAGQAVRHPGNK